MHSSISSHLGEPTKSSTLKKGLPALPPYPRTFSLTHWHFTQPTQADLADCDDILFSLLNWKIFAQKRVSTFHECGVRNT